MTDPTGGLPQVTPSWTPPPPYAYGYPYQPAKKTNGLAIASMVISIVSLVGMCSWGPLSLIPSAVAAILGHVARAKLKRKDEQGGAMALVGIILGWVGFVVSVALVIAFIYLWNDMRDFFYIPIPEPTEDPGDGF
ncbi:MAG TPA: DUF4190 domain-containing protein [Candidatus Limnocylindrales bacterium]